jgi:hypothetical protein
MDRKSWPERHPVLSGAAILLALAAVATFWRPFLVLAILAAIGGGVFYLTRWAKRRNPARSTGAAPGRQPQLTMKHGSIVIGPGRGSGRPSEGSSLDRHGRYKRQPSDYRRPPSPLMLDGSSSWLASTGWDNQRILGRLPTGADIVVEALPEPGNPPNRSSVALDFDGMRVGYWSLSTPSMFRAVVEANNAGFHVLMRAKVWKSDSRRRLEVRAAFAADLKKWLSLPPDIRGTEFFEFDWTRTDAMKGRGLRSS